MAQFPTSLKSFAENHASGQTVASSHVNELEDELNAVQEKIGIDSDSGPTSIDYLLKHTSSSNPGHKHTLANGATDVDASAGEINKACDLTVNEFFSNTWDDSSNPTALWFWNANTTALQGWTYESTSADNVIATKGGSGSYNAAGGTVDQGTWDNSTGASVGSHYHTWLVAGDANTSHKVYANGSSTAAVYTTVDAVKNAGVSVLNSAVHTSDQGITSYWGTASGTWGTSHTTPTFTSTSTYRPKASLGIICSLD